MTLFGIRKRPRNTMEHRFDEDPSYAPIDLLDQLGIVPRDQRDFPAQNPSVSLLDTPGNTRPPLPSSGRIAESTNQPASSSIGSTVVHELAHQGAETQPQYAMTGADGKAPMGAQTPKSGSAGLREEYERTRQPAKDTNGRIKSAIWNAFLQMGQQANRALATGRPIDEYALAGVAGRGIGGAGRGAFDPSVDEQYKRHGRMADLEHQIQQQVKIEQEQAQTANIEADTTYRQAKPNIEAAELDEKRQARGQKEFFDRLGIKGRDKDRIVRIYNDLPEFDPESPDPRVQQLLQQASKLDIALPPKKRNDRINMQVTPDGRVFLHDGQGNVKEASDPKTGQPYNVSRPKDESIPPTFYRGKDQDRVKNDAIAEVLSKPEYHQSGMRPEILAVYENDVSKVQDAIEVGTLTTSQVFTDPSKGARFDRDLAATHSRLARSASEFDAGLDMTSKSPSAVRMTLADFEQAYANFEAQRDRAKTPKERQEITRRFHQELRRVRLVGE